MAFAILTIHTQQFGSVSSCSFLELDDGTATGFFSNVNAVSAETLRPWRSCIRLPRGPNFSHSALVVAVSIDVLVAAISFLMFFKVLKTFLNCSAAMEAIVKVINNELNVEVLLRSVVLKSTDNTGSTDY